MDPQDYIEIQQLYAAYGHRMDSGDADGWAALYTEDGAWEKLDGPGGRADFGVYGRADLAAFAREDFAGRGSGAGRHWMGNVLLDGEAPKISGRTYGFLIQMVEGEIRWQVHANFEDDLVKTDEGWLFARRAAVPLGEVTIPSE